MNYQITKLQVVPDYKPIPKSRSRRKVLPTKEELERAAAEGRATQIVLPRLHPSQIQILESDARFKVIAAGRRFGKGILTISEWFKRGIMGKKCRWIAPTYASDSYQAGWGIATHLAKQIPGVTVRLQARMFDFSALGGGWLQFRTAEEPDSLRGEGLDAVAIDEAAHVSHLQDIWEQCIRPSLMDRKGDAWFISTPKGYNYFSQLWNRGRDKETGWASFQFSTYDNPSLDKAEIEAMKRDMPVLVARQEVYAEFVQLAGALFKRENIRIVERAPEGLTWVRPWDLAFTTKTTSDWTASGQMAIGNDGTLYIRDVIHERLEWPDAVRLIARVAQQDGIAVRQGIECVGAQVGMLQTLMRDPLLATLRFEPIQVHADKLTRALPVVARSEQGKLALVRGAWNQGWLDEAMSFPEGSHDDQIDSVSAGLMMLSTPTGAFDDRNIHGVRVPKPELTFRDDYIMD